MCRQFRGKPDYGSWLLAAEGGALLGLNRQTDADASFLAAFKDADPQEVPVVFERMKEGYGLENALAKLGGWVQGPLGRNWQPAQFLGVQLMRGKKDYAGAVRFLRKALDLAGTPEEKAEVSVSLGVACQQAGRHAEAEQAYLDALKLLPSNWQVLNNLAYLYATHLDRPADALTYVKQAYEQRPSSAAVVDTYGWTLAMLGRYDDAQNYLAQAADLDRRDPIYRYHLGSVHEKKGLLQSARRQYEQALRQAKESEDAQMTDTITEALSRVMENLQAEGKQ